MTMLNHAKKLCFLVLFIALSIQADAQWTPASPGGGAVLVTGGVNLTPTASGNNAGCLWSSTPISFLSCWTISFYARIDETPGYSPGDGFVLAFKSNSSTTSLNMGGGYLGYYNTGSSSINADFQNSFGIEFDHFFNPNGSAGWSNWNDDMTPFVDHISVQRNACPSGGSPCNLAPRVPWLASSGNISDDSIRLYEVTWDPATTTLTIKVAGSVRISSVYDYTQIFTDPSSVTFGFTGGKWSASGNHVITSITASPCNSVTTNLSDTICEGQYLVFAGDTLTQAGMYSETYTNSTGNDSVVILQLNVTPTTYTTLQAAICPGASYSFGGTQLSQAGTYYDTLNAVTGCDSVLILNLSISPIPQVDVYDTACPGQVVSFNGQNLSAAGVYQGTFTGANGCDSVVTLHLYIGAPTANAGMDQGVCSGGTATLQGNPVAGASYQWVPATGLSNPTVVNPVVTVPSTGGTTITYAFIVNANGGCSDTDSVVVSVLPLPAVYAGPDQNVCAGTIQLQGSGTGTLLWTPPVNLTDPSDPGTTANVTGSTSYTLTATSSQGCTNNDLVLIAVSVGTPHTITPDTANLCPGDSVLLLATGGNSYLWLPSTGLTSYNTSNPMASPDVTTLYEVVIYDNICNSIDTLTSYIVRHPFPTVNAYSSNDLNCRNAFTILHADGAQGYGWTPTETLLNANNDSTRASPITNTTYYVVGVDQWGCVGQSKVDVAVSYEGYGQPLVPNAFTPDGDGLNDCYKLTIPGFVPKFQLRIFNRWGQQVFYSTNPNDCWDGTYNGKPCEMGTYVYYYTSEDSYCGALKGKGNFHLLR